MTSTFTLADALELYRQRPALTYTPGLLSKLSGVPKATLVNWLEGRVARPRHWQDLIKVAQALRLSEVEATGLLRAAGHPALEQLRMQTLPAGDWGLLAPWVLPSQAPTRATPRTNLTLVPTALYGREDQIAAILARLRGGAVRLVTLTGPAGVGKTRLGLQVASEVLAVGEREVFFVCLAPLRDPRLVVPTIARTLALPHADGAATLDTLGVYLRGHPGLLVLDNCEHLVRAAPHLARLLAEAPELQILATSRERLRIRAEHEFPVRPLSVPRSAQEQPADLARYASVRLFVERARAVRADFALTDATAPTIAAICMRLEGLPLALELAAAWVKLLPPAAILGRLERRLDLLTGGPRDLPGRQRTMRAAIAWSYDLLSVAEQRLFRRLAVFADGCTLAAAESVCGSGGPGEAPVLDGIAALVNKSLLQPEEGARRVPRFMMLETIREFAAECLEHCLEAEPARRRHAIYYRALAEEAASAAPGPGAAAWLEQLEEEQHELRAALEWGSSHHEGAILVRLAVALAGFWRSSGRAQEGCRWLERGLSQPGLDEGLRAQASIALDVLARPQDDWA